MRFNTDLEVDTAQDQQENLGRGQDCCKLADFGFSISGDRQSKSNSSPTANHTWIRCKGSFARARCGISLLLVQISDCN